MATTSKPKRSKIEALIIIAIFIASAVVAGFAMVRDAAGTPPVIVIESQPPEPVISGDTVFVNDTKVFLSATPHTLNMSTWVEIHFISKLFTGEIDVAFGFNTSTARPLKAEQWTGFEWIPWVTDFERVDHDFMGMDRWLILRNRTVDAMTEYAIRIWMELEFNGGNAGKYFFGVKPSSLTIQEAISANKLYFVDPWWSTDFGFRQRLTFDNSASTTDLTDFTVLVALDSGNFNHSRTQAAGQDIRFIDADNSTSLDYEIEDWDPALNISSVWVQVPQIDALSMTDHIWMYYGNATIGDNQDVTGTWDANFMMVQHFQEATNATLVDSTSNNNDGIGYPLADPPVSVTDYIDGAWDFDATNDFANVTDSATINPAAITVEVIVTPEGGMDATPHDIVDRGSWSRYSLRSNNQAWFFRVITQNGAGNDASYQHAPDYTYGETSYLAFTYETPTALIAYENGSQIGADSGDEGAITAANDDLFIGSVTGTIQFWNGTITEMRISNISRSADWIEAQQLSMGDLFITFSGEQVVTFTITFTQTGIPSGTLRNVITVNSTIYQVDELPMSIEVLSTSIVIYEYVDPITQTQNLQYVLSTVSGGSPTQSLRENSFTPTGDATVTGAYGDVGNPVFPIIFIGVFVAILLAILGVYVKTRKKG